MIVELGKKYQTRDGRAVKILCVDNVGDLSVVGVFADGEVNRWHADGTFCSVYPLTAHRDLIPVPTKHEGWGVVNKEGKLIAAFSGSDAWYEACIRQDTFGGDSVVLLTWES